MMKFKKISIVLLAVILIGSNFSFIGSVSANTAETNSDDWKLRWSDEFDGNEINMDNWSYDVPTNGRWNGEIQSYTENNAFIEDGSLILEAREEEITEEDGQTYDYSSAKLITKGKQNWTYGKVEVRAKMPTGQGIWPAIWMMPEDEPFYGTWPVSGEIDIMELLGHEPDTVHGTVHFGEPHQQIQGTYTLPDGQSFGDDYHVYSIEWEPGEIRWYIDGELYHTANDWFTKHNDNADEYTYPAPFDQDFFLIMNISVGGGWPGNPDETTVFPQQMAVDYVRVYEKDEYPIHEKPINEEEDQVREPLEDGNYVYNGSFDTDDPEVDGVEGVPNTDYWTFLQDSSANASLAVNNDALDVEIESGGDVEHGVQLLQAPIHLEKGARYKASFKAKAEAERPLKVKIGADGDRSWVDYAGQDPFTITPTWEEYEFEFTMEHATDVKARYEFNMGLNDSSISFDDVRLEKIADPEPVDPSETVRDPLPTGNHIYNGTFDQGAERMGYWEFTTDQTAEATKYIGSAVNERRFETRISDGGDNASSVQLAQSGFRLENGRQYQLTFDASAETTRDIQVAFKNADTEVVHEETITLTSNTEAHTVDFTMEAEHDNNAELYFNMGGNESDVYIDNVFLKKQPLEQVEGNLIKNGIFDGLANWSAEAYNPGKASFSVDEEGQGQAAITDIGSADWNIQLFQQGVEIEQDATYEVSFDAKSTVDRPLRLQIQHNGEEDNDWTGYFDQTVSLTDTLETYTFTFDMTEPTDVAAKFGFALGKDEEGLTPLEAHDVVIDNVLLKKVEDEDEDTDEPNPEESVITDVNELELVDHVYKTNTATKKTVVSREVIDQLDENATIEFTYQGVTATVPVSTLQTGEDITFEFGDVSDEVKTNNSDAVSELYDFRLTSNGEAIDFDEPITLTFTVDPSKISNWDNLKVIYINDDGEKTDEVIQPASYDKDNKRVVAEVSHFSIYGVFEVEDTEEPVTEDPEAENPGTEDPVTEDPETDKTSNAGSETDEDSEETEAGDTQGSNDNDSETLPNTATSLYNYLLIGLLVLAAGVFFYVRSRKKVTDK
ncbi:carbohydrate binding domain-containing protein [Gracilibacillus kekensis]|uniref:LPXTG-motif cell wall anchor domain-containing protein n=1 Tax=Gracilibacillus kekensis TaxID=1027249 RepID=A0A1M7LIZ0_9BACI|nr:carbohydrate binding domain-containing protein [Gracilibacillus kekensis]SHM77474.1 LPXTG-motif cell wall anchor domain-containing protein [Gracilibacillus kekensis]